eukprot:TRINITY_DN17866_c0_g1_i1.p1 TRINITY_DN17866_c0_g1~~TRINITY_DN17866_c0_g1_i1.p1  ORF type:complete len:349 (+),score=40.53 TRINITY_DN17866_c0_g1_i1:71-1117(+)
MTPSSLDDLEARRKKLAAEVEGMRRARAGAGITTGTSSPLSNFSHDAAGFGESPRVPSPCGTCSRNPSVRLLSPSRPSWVPSRVSACAGVSSASSPTSETFTTCASGRSRSSLAPTSAASAGVSVSTPGASLEHAELIERARAVERETAHAIGRAKANRIDGGLANEGWLSRAGEAKSSSSCDVNENVSVFRRSCGGTSAWPSTPRRSGVSTPFDSSGSALGLRFGAATAPGSPSSGRLDGSSDCGLGSTWISSSDNNWLQRSRDRSVSPLRESLNRQDRLHRDVGLSATASLATPVPAAGAEVGWRGGNGGYCHAAPDGESHPDLRWGAHHPIIASLRAPFTYPCSE